MTRYAILLAACLTALSFPAAANVLTGEALAAQIDSALEKARIRARAEISPNRMFPACSVPLDIDVALEARVRVRCAQTGWTRDFRVSPKAGTERYASDVAGEAHMVILRESLPRGTVLQSAHLQTVSAQGRLSHAAIGVVETALGRTLRVNLGAGQPLLARHLEQAWFVTLETPVTISIERQGIRIEMKGEPQANGQLGEVVPILNLSSGRVLHAVVTGKNFVSVPANMRLISAVKDCDGRETLCKGG